MISAMPSFLWCIAFLQFLGLKPLTGVHSLRIAILRFMVLAMPIVALASPLRAEPPGFLSTGALGSLSLPAGNARCNWSISNGSLLLGQGTPTISFQAGKPGLLELT